MVIFNKFILISLILFFGVLIQQSHFFYLYGAGPNFFLVGVLFLGFLRKGVKFILAVSSFLLVVSYFFIPFWFFQVLILLVLADFIALSKRFLTGSDLPDFLISIVLGTILFYFSLFLFNFSEFSFQSIFIEIFYNLILGIITSFLFLNCIKLPNY